MTCRLFVSHSSHDPESRQRLTDLVAALRDHPRGAELHVLYDKEQINPGEHWRERIGFMLNACDAAVLLIDEVALQSSWVRAEATVLSLRPDTFVIPVSFIEQTDGVSVWERLEQDSGWRVVALHRIQFTAGRPAVELADTVMDALIRAGRLVTRQSPVNLLAETIVSRFPATVGEALLAGLASDEPDESWIHDRGDARERAATRLVRLADGRGLARTAEALKTVRALTLDAMRTIIEDLAPLPINVEAAALLRTPRAAEGGAYVPTCLRTSRPQLMVERYARRADLASEVSVWRLQNAYGDFETIRSELRERFVAEVFPDPENPNRDPELVDATLEHLTGYVSVSGPLDDEVLDQLEHAFPMLSFVIHFAPDDDIPASARTTRIEPSLTAAEEKKLIVDYITACGTLSKGAA